MKKKRDHFRQVSQFRDEKYLFGHRITFLRSLTYRKNSCDLPFVKLLLSLQKAYFAIKSNRPTASSSIWFLVLFLQSDIETLDLRTEILTMEFTLWYHYKHQPFIIGTDYTWLTPTTHVEMTHDTNNHRGAGSICFVKGISLAFFFVFISSQFFN